MFCFHFVAVLLKLGLVSKNGPLFSSCKICHLTSLRITYNLPILSYSRNPSQCPQRNPTKSKGPCEWRLTFEMPKQICTSRYICRWSIVSPPSNGRMRDHSHMVQICVGQEQVTHSYSPRGFAGFAEKPSSVSWYFEAREGL